MTLTLSMNYTRHYENISISLQDFFDENKFCSKKFKHNYGKEKLADIKSLCKQRDILNFVWVRPGGDIKVRESWGGIEKELPQIKTKR